MNPLRILIAVNFTTSSDKAMAFAVQLLHTLDCHIRLIYCYSDFIELEEYAQIKLNAETSAKDVKEVFVNRLMNQEAEVKRLWEATGTTALLTLSSMSVKGEVESMVSYEADTWHPSLVVVGSSVEKNTFTELMESTASDVIDKTQSPVLVVPRNTEIVAEKMNHILFLTNFKSEEYISLHRLIELLPGHGATLHCVRYLHDHPDQWDHMRLEALREYINQTYPNHGIVCETLTGDHHLEALNHYVKEKNMGILALTRRKRKAIFKFLHPDISHKLLHHAHMPVLVFNE